MYFSMGEGLMSPGAFMCLRDLVSVIVLEKYPAASEMGRGFIVLGVAQA